MDRSGLTNVAFTLTDKGDSSVLNGSLAALP